MLKRVDLFNNKRHGEAISHDQLKQLLQMEPRRHRLIEPIWNNLPWSALRPPNEDGEDWSISFPFFESFGPALDDFCQSQVILQEMEKTPFERNDGNKVRYCYLKNSTDDQRNLIGTWIRLISEVVGIRDFLRASFALDYSRQQGNPDKEVTQIASLRQTAKLYNSDDEPKTETLAAATKLAEGLINFINWSQAYRGANCVLAVPRSDPSKKYSLPALIANRISIDLGLLDLSDKIKTSKARREMKDTPAQERLKELENTIDIDTEAVKGKHVLIIDDLYQSGTTMNYVGMLLLSAGASCVYGLACEKTCSNQD